MNNKVVTKLLNDLYELHTAHKRIVEILDKTVSFRSPIGEVKLEVELDKPQKVIIHTYGYRDIKEERKDIVKCNIEVDYYKIEFILYDSGCCFPIRICNDDCFDKAIRFVDFIQNNKEFVFEVLDKAKKKMEHIEKEIREKVDALEQFLALVKIIGSGSNG